MNEAEPLIGFSPNANAPTYSHLHAFTSASSTCGAHENSSLPHQPPRPIGTTSGHYPLHLETMTRRSSHHQVHDGSNHIPFDGATQLHEGAQPPPSPLATSLTSPQVNGLRLPLLQAPSTPLPSINTNAAHTQAQPRLRRFRHEVTLCSPLRIQRRTSLPFSKRNVALTSKQKAYAARAGLLWVAAAYDAPPGGASSVLSRAQLCEQLARQFKCVPEVVAQHCPWLHCPEEYWRLNEHDRLLSLEAPCQSILPTTIPQIPPDSRAPATKAPAAAGVQDASTEPIRSMLDEPSQLDFGIQTTPPFPNALKQGSCMEGSVSMHTPVTAPAPAPPDVFSLDEDPCDNPKNDDDLDILTDFLPIDQLEGLLPL